jgi:hypothetical protein
MLGVLFDKVGTIGLAVNFFDTTEDDAKQFHSVGKIS